MKFFSKIKPSIIVKSQNISKKHFSIIHNYHSPHILWYNGKQATFDENLNDYNKYIQTFLTKRFTHKKEIAPKIKVLKDIEKVFKEYHNTFYVQIPYPSHNLLDYSYMKYMESLKILDSGYIISRFFEENEKPMYDAALGKILVCGRVECMEDKAFFINIRNEVDRLIDVFYNGDKLSEFEREIERAYLMVKQNKFGELMAKYAANPKLKREECFLSYSERNKINGHVNFRMKHPTYFFNACPIFEKINVETMFNALYEIRYNVLSNWQIYEKLKLKFQYRKSLLKTSHRLEFLSYYMYLQIFQYLESYEFNNEFNLSLNFKVNFNLMIFHLWLVIQRLHKISLHTESKEERKYCNYLIELLQEKIINYFNNNLDNFQIIKKDTPQIVNIKKFVRKLFDLFTWHFEVVHKNNTLENIRNFLNEVIFDNAKTVNDKSLNKLCYYAYIHYEYLNTKYYKEIEHSDFNFSVNRIPIAPYEFINKNDTMSMKLQNYMEYYQTHEIKLENGEIIKHYKENKQMFFNKLKNKKVDLSLLVNTFAINPYKDSTNFVKIDYSKSLIGKFEKFIKNEFDYENAIANEKVDNK